MPYKLTWGSCITEDLPSLKFPEISDYSLSLSEAGLNLLWNLIELGCILVICSLSFLKLCRFLREHISDSCNKGNEVLTDRE